MSNIYYLIIIGMGVTFLLALSVVGFYILYQRRFLKQQLELKKTELHATIQSQEDERRRIGRDLHDGIGSLLANLRMNINRLNTAGVQEQCSLLIDKTITDVRSIAHSLSPPGLELFGLAGAVEDLCDGIPLKLSIENNAGDLKRLAPNTALALYRVIQELLSNTLKHAEATSATITFNEQNGTLTIDYTDNGKGFSISPKQTGMGLRNIESRLNMIGVTYNIISSPGNGFKTTIQVP